MICLLQIYNSFHENFHPALCSLQGSEHVGARRGVCVSASFCLVCVLSIGVCASACCVSITGRGCFLLLLCLFSSELLSLPGTLTGPAVHGHACLCVCVCVCGCVVVPQQHPLPVWPSSSQTSADKNKRGIDRRREERKREQGGRGGDMKNGYLEPLGFNRDKSINILGDPLFTPSALCLTQKKTIVGATVKPRQC